MNRLHTSEIHLNDIVKGNAKCFQGHKYDNQATNSVHLQRDYFKYYSCGQLAAFMAASLVLTNTATIRKTRSPNGLMSVNTM